jgi:mannosyl-oligosaccharide alpha-1,3-glucosidase
LKRLTWQYFLHKPFYSTEGTTGVLWLNAAETWVDIEGGARKAGDVVSSIVNFVSRSGTPEEPLEARFVSESGIIDAFLLLGPNPTDVSKSYADLTGVTPLPPVNCQNISLFNR